MAESKQKPGKPPIARGMIDTWLQRVNARRCWTETVPFAGGKSEMSAYAINGYVILVHRYRNGWEIYLPATKSNSVVTTLEAAAEFCGIEGTLTTHSVQQWAKE